MKYDFAITIPCYIREVELSKSQRAKYYQYDGVTIKGKGKKLLQKYVASTFRSRVKETGIVEPHMLHKDYALGIFKGTKLVDICGSKFPFTGKGNQIHNYIHSHKVYVINKETGKAVVSNSTQVGVPKLYTINGQDFYSGNLNPFARRKVMTAIKESYLPFLSAFPVIEKEDYPYRVQMLIFDVPKLITDNTIEDNKMSQFWDVGNRAFPYAKAFLDLLATGKTGKLASKDKTDYIQYFSPHLPDDNIMYITQDPGGARFIPIEEHEQRKLVFVFKQDKDPRVLNNKYYKQFYQ